MALRLFQCADCGHRMRLFGPSCGKCGTEKDLYQRPAPYLAGLALLTIMILVLSRL